MNRCRDSILLAEQQVAEARTAALGEYEAARAKLRHRIGSPVFIGGVLLGGIALGYLALGRSKPKRLADPGSPGAWSRAAKTVQVLLPLLMALNSASKVARRPPRQCQRNNKVMSGHGRTRKFKADIHHNQHQRQLSENANWRSRPLYIDLNYA